MNFKEFYTRTLPQEVIEDKDTPKIYCDMDGVLCDFGKGIHDIDGKTTLDDLYSKPDKFMWDLIQRVGIYEFYRDLEWLEEGKKLWNFIKGKQPTILSSLGRENPDKKGAEKGKKEWLKNHGINIPEIFTGQASEKQKYAKGGAILIDDYGKNIKEWTEAGGKAIHFKTADEAIKQLKEYGIKENIVVAPYVIVPDKSTQIDSEDK